MRDGTDWQAIFQHVCEVAALDGDADEAAAEVVALAHRSRRAVETARVHVLGSMLDPRPLGDEALALRYLDGALRCGDAAQWWCASPVELDRWAAAQHRLIELASDLPVRERV